MHPDEELVAQETSHACDAPNGDTVVHAHPIVRSGPTHIRVVSAYARVADIVGRDESARLDIEDDEAHREGLRESRAQARLRALTQRAARSPL